MTDAQPMTAPSMTTAPSTPSPSPPPLPWIERGHHAAALAFLIWLEVALLWLIVYRHNFALLAFRDPDDAMRLVEVRDWLAGQSWFDVSQHRANPPIGGPMHWSRLVDLPIAGLILLLRPLLGPSLAEIVACVSVPLLTLGALFATLFAGLRPFLGAPRALLGVALLAASFPITMQGTPLRIDHHAWQIVMAAALMAGLLHPRARMGGWIMGGAMAIWLQISSEGLPYAALAGAILAGRHALRAEEWARLWRYALALAGGSAALLLATHGWSGSLARHCDALSPVYLGPLLLLPPVMAAGHALFGVSTPLRRLAPALLAGLAAAALFLATAGPCLAGPFRMLDPFVYRFWYSNVAEGLPIWEQTRLDQAALLAPLLAGLIGQALAIRTEKDPDTRLAWLSLFALTLGAAAVALTVMRAVGVAHLYALTGLLWLIARLYPAIRRRPSAGARILLTAALGLLSPIGLAAAATAFVTHILPDRQGSAATTGPTPADSIPAIRALRALPPATLLAPIDIGPTLLVQTQHSVIGTAHHRNARGIEAVMRTFLSPPDQARAVVSATRADYLLVPRDGGEMKAYRSYDRNDLAARLARGEVPRWLVPVPLPGLGPLRLYRIDRNAR